MNTEMTGNFYNDTYKYGYDWGVYNPMGEEIIQVMYKCGAQKKKILDIGCGIGWFTDLIYFNISKDVTGIDFSTIAIKFHARNLFPCCKFHVASAYDFDYNGYDIYTAVETLEHLDDLKILERIPSGKMFFGSVPFADKRDCEQHLREYTVESLKERYAPLMDVNFAVKFQDDFIIFHGVRK